MEPKGTIGYIPSNEELVGPFEKHTADSKWQYCMCETCQRHRKYLQARSDKPINWDTLRLKDERY